jgi:MFS family permease
MTSQRIAPPESRARWGPLCGVAFVVLLAVSFFIVSTPNTNKSPAYIYAWYNKSSHKTALGISTVLADIAVVFGIFFFGYLRDRWGRTDLGSRLAPILLAGAILFAGGGLAFSGATFALLDSPKHMSPDTAQTLNFLQSDLGAAGITVGVSIIMWAAGFIILKTRILPVWLAWVSFVLGVVALAGPIGFFAFLATGIWILIVAYFMWRFEVSRPGSEDVPEGRPAATSEGASA